MSAALVLIATGILFRTIFHLGDNIEMITSGALVSGAYLGLFWAIAVPLTSMAVSDVILGNSLIFLFTWSAYLFIGFAGFLVFYKKKRKSGLLISSLVSAGTASVFFYLWTNFGVWYLDDQRMYAKTIGGLLDAYLLGLPFLKMNLIGNLVFVPLFFSIFSFLQMPVKAKKSISAKYLSVLKIFKES